MQAARKCGLFYLPSKDYMQKPKMRCKTSRLSRFYHFAIGLYYFMTKAFRRRLNASKKSRRDFLSFYDRPFLIISSENKKRKSGGDFLKNAYGKRFLPELLTVSDDNHQNN